MLDGLLFSISISFWLKPLISRLEFYNKLSLVERLILVIALSTSVIVILLSISSLIQLVNFATVSQYLGFITLLGIVTGLDRRYLLVYPRLVISFLKSKPITLLLLAIFIKILLLYTLQPIGDSDIVNTYLPYAKTIIETGYAAKEDKYTGNPMTIPPIGGPALLAYSLSQKYASSSIFQYYTLFSFVGILLISYLFGRQVFKDNDRAIFSMSIVASLPLIDSALSTWKLYPDIIAAFLGLTSLYLLLYKSNIKSNLLPTAMISGICFAGMLLLKSQSLIFIYYSIVIAGLAKGLSKKLIFKIMSYFALIFPVIASLTPIGGVTNFGYGSPSYITIIVTVVLTSILYKQILNLELNDRGNIWLWTKYLLFLVIFLSPGFIWFARNIYFYGQYVTPSIAEYLQIAEIKSSLGLYLLDQKSHFSELFVFILPVFGSLAFIPKLVGLFRSFLYEIQRKFISLFFILFSVSSSIYFGGTDPRYFLGIIPFIGILVIDGIELMYSYIFRSDKLHKKLLYVYTIFFAIASLSQSVFLTWGAFALIYPSSTLSNIANNENISNIGLSGGIDYKQQISNFVIQFGKIYTISADLFTSNNLIPLVGIGIFFSISLVIISIFLSTHLITFTHLKAQLKGMLVAFILLPYIILIILYGKGSIVGYKQNYENIRLDYWGLNSVIVPLLKESANKESIILIIGPNVPLSYQTGLLTRNMVVSYGIKDILPALELDKKDDIYFWLKEHHIDFVLVYRNDNYDNKLKVAQDKTTLFSMISDKNYFSLVSQANSQSNWDLYSLRSL